MGRISPRYNTSGLFQVPPVDTKGIDTGLQILAIRSEHNITPQIQHTQDITSLGVWFLLKKKNYSSTRKNKPYTKLTNKIDQQTLVTYKQATSFMGGPSESQTDPIATAYPRK